MKEKSKVVSMLTYVSGSTFRLIFRSGLGIGASLSKEDDGESPKMIWFFKSDQRQNIIKYHLRNVLYQVRGSDERKLINYSSKMAYSTSF